MNKEERRELIKRVLDRFAPTLEALAAYDEMSEEEYEEWRKERGYDDTRIKI